MGKREQGLLREQSTWEGCTPREEAKPLELSRWFVHICTCPKQLIIIKGSIVLMEKASKSHLWKQTTYTVLMGWHSMNWTNICYCGDVKITNIALVPPPKQLSFTSCYSSFPFSIVSFFPRGLTDSCSSCLANWFSLHILVGLCAFNCMFHCLTTFSSYSMQTPTSARGCEVTLSRVLWIATRLSHSLSRAFWVRLTLPSPFAEKQVKIIQNRLFRSSDFLGHH